ncbi:MAG: YHS domain-containing protein [Actinobacteria bacterium]|nr:MAG: YHS domain-containing protein [Actinomycetota bacterium]
MADVISKLGDGLWNAVLMAWQVWWALVLGFAISAIVQAWVPRERIEHSLAGEQAGAIARATGLGAASSSCSYAAIAIAKSLFQKGASAASALAFQFASTNLVWELGLVLWVLIGWQFTLAEYLGGIVMIVLMWTLLRVFVSRELETEAREHAVHAQAGHIHNAVGSELPWRQRLTSLQAWTDVAHNFRGDWKMLYKEISIGFVLAGFIALLGDDFFNGLFLESSSSAVQVIWGALIGPVIAVLSFVCSVGNVPLAAVLWSGGISFSGVMAFIFADLIVLPIILAYRKYYGTRFALRITGLMYVTMVIAAILIDLLFSALGLIPDTRPSTDDVFGSIEVNYKLVLNLFGLAIFASLMWLTVRGGATDPVCGMSVDKGRAKTAEYGGRTYYFCSDHCKATFEHAHAH